MTTNAPALPLSRRSHSSNNGVYYVHDAKGAELAVTYCDDDGHVAQWLVDAGNAAGAPDDLYAAGLAASNRADDAEREVGRLLAVLERARAQLAAHLEDRRNINDHTTRRIALVIAGLQAALASPAQPATPNTNARDATDAARYRWLRDRWFFDAAIDAQLANVAASPTNADAKEQGNG